MPTPDKSSGRRGSKSNSDSRGSFNKQSSETENASGQETEGIYSPDDTAVSGLQGGDGGTGAGNQADAGSQSGAGAAGAIRQFLRDTTYEQLGTQKQRATEGLGTIAQAVRNSGQQLRDSGQGKTAEYIDKAASEIERISGSLRDRDLQDLLDEVQRFARRQPAVFIGTAFGLGLLAARFLKSSNQRGEPRSAQGSRWNRSGIGATGSTQGSDFSSGEGSTGTGASSSLNRGSSGSFRNTEGGPDGSTADFGG